MSGCFFLKHGVVLLNFTSSGVVCCRALAERVHVRITLPILLYSGDFRRHILPVDDCLHHLAGLSLGTMAARQTAAMFTWATFENSVVWPLEPDPVYVYVFRLAIRTPPGCRAGRRIQRQQVTSAPVSISTLPSHHTTFACGRWTTNLTVCLRSRVTAVSTFFAKLSCGTTPTVSVLVVWDQLVIMSLIGRVQELLTICRWIMAVSSYFRQQILLWSHSLSTSRQPSSWSALVLSWSADCHCRCRLPTWICANTTAVFWWTQYIIRTARYLSGTCLHRWRF